MMCDYCGKEIEEPPRFELTYRAGDGQLSHNICSENCLVAFAVGSPSVGGRP